MDFVNDSDYLDQHFLINENIINKFIDVSNFSKDDVVIEIGPGKGVITEKIAPKVKKMYCIELDTRLKPFLDNICSRFENIDVIYNSVLNIDLPECNKILTALPYSILEPFINKMTNCKFDKLIMIVGNKYAESVSNKEITYTSLMTNSFFKFENIMDISPDNFHPAPRVMSSMVILTPKDDSKNDVYYFFKNMYRLNHKKIKNALIETIIKCGIFSTQREAKRLIDELNLSIDLLDTKFEVCSNEQLLELFNNVNKIYENLNHKND